MFLHIRAAMRKRTYEELARKSVEEFRKSEKLSVIIVLDDVRSLHNVGAAFRTADAFSAEAIYLCGITGTPPHRDIHKAALGATESVEWKYFEKTVDAVHHLKQIGFEVIAIEQAEGSISLEKFIPNKNSKYAFVFGNEMNGVSDEVLAILDAAIEIPQSGTKHSLNISVSLGVVMWEIYKRLSL